LLSSAVIEFLLNPSTCQSYAWE